MINKNITQGEIVYLSFKDLLSRPMLKIAFLPFVVTLIVLYFGFFQLASMGLDIVFQSQSLDGQTIDTTGYWIVDMLLKYSITSWIVSSLVYAIGGFAMFWVSLFVAIIIIGFLTPYILENLRDKHYPSLEFVGYATIQNSVLFLIKTLLIMTVLFVVLVPLYFIPLVNVLAVNYPFYYFFHKMLHFDVGSTILTKDEHKKLKTKNGYKFMLYTLFLYLLSLIPFVALILPVFYIIYIGHNYMRQLDNKMMKQEGSTIILQTKLDENTQS